MSTHFLLRQSTTLTFFSTLDPSVAASPLFAAEVSKKYHEEVACRPLPSSFGIIASVY
jgi:hypothetical protein